jgi:cytochrome c-type biogenesis protein CcmH
MTQLPHVRWLVALLCCVGLGTAVAQEAKPLAEDPVLEARVMAIAEELRCLVCQNETIAASHADLAVDLRKQIRQKLQQGQTQAQILEFMVQRYGDFVLYRPPVKSSTWLLWGGPFLLLAVAVAALALNIRRRRTLAAAPLKADEAERVRRLLAEEKNPS